MEEIIPPELEEELPPSLLSRDFAKSSLNGWATGALSCIVCAPLDVAKIRLQVQGSLGLHKYSGGVLSIIRKIYGEEGIRGLFRGIGPSLLCVPLFWGSYFPIYEYVKLHMQKDNPKITSWYEYYVHVCAAVSAGAVSDIITNPFWVTRTRMQTLILHDEYKININRMNTVKMMCRIYQQEGILAFYKGLGASFLGLSHVAIYWPLYERCKKFGREYRGNHDLNLFDLVLATIFSKTVASTITFPHEVLRSRLQDNTAKHVSMRKILLDAVRKEGFFSLWTGLRVNLIRIIPSTLTTMLPYEYLSKYSKEKS